VTKRQLNAETRRARRKEEENEILFFFIEFILLVADTRDAGRGLPRLIEASGVASHALHLFLSVTP
jgi:hypothetical protein